MRLFAVSDLHVDYPDNAQWVQSLSRWDYRDDALIVAGDLSHRPHLLGACLGELAARFARVLFVPGNHDLWVLGEDPGKTSLDKLDEVRRLAHDHGATTRAWRHGATLVAPLLGWYDHGFGEPGEELKQAWMDYRACRWPPGYDAARIAAHLAALDPLPPRKGVARTITVSHFLPRLDLIPDYVPARHRILDPVLGSAGIERRLRALGADLHVYGHSHINRDVVLDGVRYVNNAFGYPQETGIAARRLLCVEEI